MPGSIPITIPPPTVQYDTDVFWPPLQSYTGGGAFEQNGSVRYNGTVSGIQFWGAAVGAGTTNMATFLPSMLICSQWASLAGQPVHRGSDFNIHTPLLKGGVPATFQYPTQYRLWRIQFLFGLQAAVVPSGKALTFVGLSNNGGAGPTQAGNGYFGFGADPDGTWHFISRRGAILFGLDDDVSVFPLDGNQRLIDMVILSATGAADAQLQVYLNGNYSSPLLTRSWGVGSVLPTYATAGAATSTGFVMFAGSEDTATVTVMQIGPCRIMGGHFQANGAEI